jgi:hypothetical protein
MAVVMTCFRVSAPRQPKAQDAAQTAKTDKTSNKRKKPEGEAAAKTDGSFQHDTAAETLGVVVTDADKPKKQIRSPPASRHSWWY